jgi:CheY-like chemotaxis protein
MSSDRKVILLVEDLEDDILLSRRAFAAAKLDVPLQIVRDGEEAIAYLMGTGKYARRDEFPLPDLILLDLKMPKVNGLDVLRWIRSHPQLKTLRVIVLTSSEDIYDVNRAYELGANSFLVKPAEFICYPSLVRTLEKFWLRSSVGPTVGRPPVEANSNPQASA